jgi:ribosomal protein S2
MQQIYSESYVLRLEKRIEELEAALERIASLGHNEECLFCGLKDKEVLLLRNAPRAKKPDAQPTEKES